MLSAQLSAFAAGCWAESARRAPAVTQAVDRVTRCLQDLWPRLRTSLFGSQAVQLALPSSDVDLLVHLPPVRHLPPIEEAGILEGRNGVNETLLQQAARQLSKQGWVRSVKVISQTAIPLITLLVVSNPADPDSHVVRLDITFDSPRHQGLATAELVRALLAQQPPLAPLALALKQFLAQRHLHHAYTGGLSSYCLVLMLSAHLKHAAALGGWGEPGGKTMPSLGALFADVLHFFGVAFDPRAHAVSLVAPPGEAQLAAGAIFPSRGTSSIIDALHLCDPLSEGGGGNVGRNCFRLLQITTALGDASRSLDQQLQGGGGGGAMLLAGLIDLQGRAAG